GRHVCSPAGGVDVRDDYTEPGGHRPTPQGQYCPSCGAHEADPWARFCGSCGATLDGASATATTPGNPAGRSPVPPAPAPPGGYDVSPRPYQPPAAPYAATYAPASP